MEKIIQFLTKTQNDAYTVVETLKKLNEANDISVAEIYVIEKDATGKVVLKNSEGQTPDNALFGTFVGGMLGVIGGPLGMLAGSSLGLLTGSLFDLGKYSDTDDYLNEVSKNIPNGKCVVVAHVYEEWETPINSKLSEISEITRINVDEEVEKAIQSDIDTINKDITKAETEIKEAIGEEKEAISKKIDELKAKKEAKVEQLKNRVNTQKKAYKTWFEKVKAKIKS